MSRAIRVKEGLMVRFIRKVMTSKQTKERRFFAATDINLAQDRWMDMNISLPDIPGFSIPTMPVLNTLPALDLVDGMSGKSSEDCVSENDRPRVSKTVWNLPIPSNQLALPQKARSFSGTINIEDLIESLKICEIPVQKVEKLPSGVTRISVKSMPDGQQIRAPEFEPVYRR